MKTVTALALVLLVTANGCGTIVNCFGPDFGDKLLPYRGVAVDTDGIKQNAAAPVRPIALAMCACDIPLSAVADTILLPFTIMHAEYAHERFLQSCRDRRIHSAVQVEEPPDTIIAQPFRSPVLAGPGER